MKVWAIADLHLSFGVPNKQMDIFGDAWIGYHEKLTSHWRSLIKAEDLVLIAGDISWAMHLEEAVPDLEWVHQLPGTKVLIKGNHDYWWSSLSKIEKVLPSSIHLIQNNAFNWNEYSIGGSRLWDSPEYQFKDYILYKPSGKPLTTFTKDFDEDRKIFNRELTRLETSLKALDQDPKKIRLVMTHYPPISATLQDSTASKLLEKYHVSGCVFGHLHSVKKDVSMFGEKNGVRYSLTSCDYLDFKPLRVS